MRLLPLRTLPISTLFAPKAINASPATGLPGLLDALGTISKGVSGNIRTGAAAGTVNPVQMLQAFSLIGTVLSGGAAASTASPTAGLVQSGMNIVQSLMNLMSATRSTDPTTTSLIHCIDFLKVVGGFMGQLSAV